MEFLGNSLYFGTIILKIKFTSRQYILHPQPQPKQKIPKKRGSQQNLMKIKQSMKVSTKISRRQGQQRK